MAAAAALVRSSLAPLLLSLIFYSSLRRKVTLLVINFAPQGTQIICHSFPCSLPEWWAFCCADAGLVIGIGALINLILFSQHLSKNIQGRSSSEFWINKSLTTAVKQECVLSFQLVTFGVKILSRGYRGHRPSWPWDLYYLVIVWSHLLVYEQNIYNMQQRKTCKITFTYVFYERWLFWTI